MKFFILFLPAKQNSIFIGQKIHMEFHHHYKNTKTWFEKGKWKSKQRTHIILEYTNYVF